MEYTTIGTSVKLLLDFKVEGTQLAMSDYDFTARFFTYANHYVDITKGEMVEADGCYIAIVPTDDLLDGELRVEIAAYLPDGDAVTGLRAERCVLSTGIHLRRTMYELP